jgi:hypothetical protein
MSERKEVRVTSPPGYVAPAGVWIEFSTPDVAPGSRQAWFSGAAACMPLGFNFSPGGQVENCLLSHACSAEQLNERVLCRTNPPLPSPAFDSLVSGCSSDH